MSRYVPPGDDALAWVASRCGVGAVVVRAVRLVGGITAAVDRVTVRHSDGRELDVVLRRSTSTQPWTDGLVEREAAGLAVAAAHVSAPELIAVDATGEAAGVRCILTTLVPGQPLLAPTDLDDWLGQLAAAQARIHAIAPTLPDRCDASFDPSAQLDPAAQLAWLTDPGLRRDARAAALAMEPDSQPVFAHGDYQHFNVLWVGDRLSGIVDWTMAGTGPRRVDVGHCRLNLAVLFGPEAAQRYLQRYTAAAGVLVDPRAELRALLSWAPAWLDFIPRQLAGRATLPDGSMADRVEQTVRRTLTGLT